MKTQQDVKIGAKGTVYGNWMSLPVMKMAYGISGTLAFVLILIALLWKNIIAIAVAALLFLVMLGFTLFLQKVRNTFSFPKGKLMDKIQQNLMSHLNWDGKGTVLDVGCGSAALSARVAKTYENAQVVGIDYWGPMWDYSQAICVKNAELEGVSSQCHFQHGDATKLEFEDETFDAVVSNFVYHEVLGAADKKVLLLETLRVLKKGGAFALQDFFNRAEMFGTPEEMVAFLKNHGIAEVHYEGDVDHKPWMPSYVIKPFIIKDIGVFWGVK